jgi:hypothetical protein
MTEVKRTTSLRSQLPLSERWRNVKINALLVFVSMVRSALDSLHLSHNDDLAICAI